MLKCYVECLRSDASDEDKVFLTSMGNHVAKASDDLKHLAQHFGEELTLTPTLHRKMLATKAAANLKDEEVRKVATHMTHDVNTARKYYHVQRNKDTAMEAYQLLNQPENDLFLAQQSYLDMTLLFCRLTALQSQTRKTSLLHQKSQGLLECSTLKSKRKQFSLTLMSVKKFHWTAVGSFWKKKGICLREEPSE